MKNLETIYSVCHSDPCEPCIKLYGFDPHKTSRRIEESKEYERLIKIQKAIDERNRKLKAQEEKLLNDLERQRYGKI